MKSDEIMGRIDSIAATKSSTLKKTQLSVNMQKVLLYAYDPYRKFKIKKLPPDLHGRGFKQFNDTTWRLLDTLANSKGVTNKLKETTFKYIRSLTPASARLFKRILLKDLRCGIAVKGINDVFPNLVPEFLIMKAEPLTAVDSPCFPVYSGLKYDGIRAIYMPRGEFVTGKGHPIVGMDHIIKRLKQYSGHPYPLDGELYILGLPFEVAAGLILNNKPCPFARFFVFDVITFDLPFYQRYGYIDKTIPNTAEVSPLVHKIIETEKDLKLDFHFARRMGFEGLVIKDPDHFYQTRRSTDWLKVKETYSVDIVVKGIIPGKGKYTGIVGALECDYKGHAVKVGSGLSDDLRYNLWHEQFSKSSIIGKTIEVEYMETTKKGSLRHPRFVRTRLDK